MIALLKRNNDERTLTLDSGVTLQWDRGNILLFEVAKGAYTYEITFNRKRLLSFCSQQEISSKNYIGCTLELFDETDRVTYYGNLLVLGMKYPDIYSCQFLQNAYIDTTQKFPNTIIVDTTEAAILNYNKTRDRDELMYFYPNPNVCPIYDDFTRMVMPDHPLAIRIDKLFEALQVDIVSTSAIQKMAVIKAPQKKTDFSVMAGYYIDLEWQFDSSLRYQSGEFWDCYSLWGRDLTLEDYSHWISTPSASNMFVNYGLEDLYCGATAVYTTDNQGMPKTIWVDHLSYWGRIGYLHNWYFDTDSWWKGGKSYFHYDIYGKQTPSPVPQGATSVNSTEHHEPRLYLGTRDKQPVSIIDLPVGVYIMYITVDIPQLVKNDAKGTSLPSDTVFKTGLTVLKSQKFRKHGNNTGRVVIPTDVNRGNIDEYAYFYTTNLSDHIIMDHVNGETKSVTKKLIIQNTAPFNYACMFLPYMCCNYDFKKRVEDAPEPTFHIRIIPTTPDPNTTQTQVDFGYMGQGISLNSFFGEKKISDVFSALCGVSGNMFCMVQDKASIYNLKSLTESVVTEDEIQGVVPSQIKYKADGMVRTTEIQDVNKDVIVDYDLALDIYGSVTSEKKVISASDFLYGKLIDLSANQDIWPQKNLSGVDMISYNNGKRASGMLVVRYDPTELRSLEDSYLAMKLGSDYTYYLDPQYLSFRYDVDSLTNVQVRLCDCYAMTPKEYVNYNIQLAKNWYEINVDVLMNCRKFRLFCLDPTKSFYMSYYDLETGNIVRSQFFCKKYTLKMNGMCSLELVRVPAILKEMIKSNTDV